MRKYVLCFAAILILMLMCRTDGIAKQPATEAVVTAVDGSARVFTGRKTTGRALKKGDRLGREHEVRVGNRSRVEIRFPDGTVMRLSEKTRLAMNEVRYDRKSRTKKIRVNLWMGRLWANVRKLATPDSSVEVRTATAVAGVRGTVYRMNVEEDKSSLIKVYGGSVYVSSPPKEPADQPSAQFSVPMTVSGPHEVAPPMHEVTMEEWHVIVKAMQQVSISSQGVASRPQEFDMNADADEWVKWNQERDKLLML